MRIGLIAALRRSEDGRLRAELPLAGRSVLAWQAALLGSLGIERVLCLSDSAATGSEVLQLQHALEGSGMAFHALKGFAALPALVRAEDDLVIIADGLVPDPGVVCGALQGEGTLNRMIATIPSDHPLAAAHPLDFERIDAGRCWAGVLTMRGAAVQQLAEMPPDADAISLLLRLALQAGTPTRDFAMRELTQNNWLLAESAGAAARHESDMVARAAPPADWRAPGVTLAAALVRALVPRGLAQGGVIAGGLGLALLLGAVLCAAFGPATPALVMAGIGAFAAQASLGFTTIASHLRRETAGPRSIAVLSGAVDLLSSLTLWFALAPWPMWDPLAMLGPVTIGLARYAGRAPNLPLGSGAPDRTLLLVLLTLGSTIGRLPEAIACLALGLLAALLLRRAQD